MKSQWVILLVSAFTDAIITFGTALTAAMMASEVAAMPNNTALLLASIGSLVSFARTVQQALKATPAATAELKGEPIPPPAR